MCGVKKRNKKNKKRKSFFQAKSAHPLSCLKFGFLKNAKIKSLKEMVGIHNYQNLQTRQNI